MRLLLRWVLLALSVVASSYLTKALGLGFEAGADDFGGFLRLMLGVAVLALLNATLGNILKLLTLPLTCLTLGFFSLAINAMILIWAASLNLGFSISETEGWPRFWTAFIAAVLISAVSAVLGSIFFKEEKKEAE